MHSVKISARNQVALPQDALDDIGAHVGERLVVRVHEGILELIPERLVSTFIDRGLKAFRQTGIEGFERHWDNPDDEIWDEA